MLLLERLNSNNAEEYIAYLKVAMKEEPDKMTAAAVDEQHLSLQKKMAKWLGG